MLLYSLVYSPYSVIFPSQHLFLCYLIFPPLCLLHLIHLAQIKYYLEKVKQEERGNVSS